MHGEAVASPSFFPGDLKIVVEISPRSNRSWHLPPSHLTCSGQPAKHFIDYPSRSAGNSIIACTYSTLLQ